MGHEQHRHEAPRTVAVYVVTASDTRGEAEDESGRFLRDALRAAGHLEAGYRIVKDEPAQLRAALEAARAAGADAILVNGGTGIAGRDRTYEAVAGLLEKRLDGFGELFRMLSFQEIGSAAMLSRAVAGVWDGRAVFSVPGSLPAVRLAWDRLIGPELGHVIRELRKDRRAESHR
jgi:molybdopterin adenylyltransferase